MPGTGVHLAPALRFAFVARSNRSRHELRCCADRVAVGGPPCTVDIGTCARRHRSRGSGASSSSALAPLPERADASPDGRRVGRIAEEHIAESPARAAAKARPVRDRAIRLSKPPVMHASAHGRTSVTVMVVCAERPLALRATSSTTWRSSSKAMPFNASRQLFARLSMSWLN